MTVADLAREARQGAVRQHSAVMEALDDETFMAAVVRGLSEMRAGAAKKTFAELDAELEAKPS